MDNENEELEKVKGLDFNSPAERLKRLEEHADIKLKREAAEDVVKAFNGMPETTEEERKQKEEDRETFKRAEKQLEVFVKQDEFYTQRLTPPAPAVHNRGDAKELARAADRQVIQHFHEGRIAKADEAARNEGHQGDYHVLEGSGNYNYLYVGSHRAIPALMNSPDMPIEDYVFDEFQRTLVSAGVTDEAVAGILGPMENWGNAAAMIDTPTSATGRPRRHYYSLDVAGEIEFIDENISADTTERDHTWGTIQIGIYDITTGWIPVSIKSERDMEVNTRTELEARLINRMGSRLNHAVTTRDNSTANRPHGMLASAKTGITITFDRSQVAANANNSTAPFITYARLNAFVGELDSRYRAQASTGQVGWQMNRKTLQTIRGLVDANGRPIVTQQISEGLGAVDMLFGYPVAINDDMPDVPAVPTGSALTSATNDGTTSPIMFGDFGSFTRPTLGGLIIVRYDEFKFRNRGQVAYQPFWGFGSDYRYGFETVNVHTSVNSVLKYDITIAP